MHSNLNWKIKEPYISFGFYIWMLGIIFSMMDILVILKFQSQKHTAMNAFFASFQDDNFVYFPQVLMLENTGVAL